MDVSAVHHGGTLLRYSASLLGYGFYGDIIRDSEKKRWMGLIRYDFSGGSAGRPAPPARRPREASARHRGRGREPGRFWVPWEPPPGGPGRPSPTLRVLLGGRRTGQARGAGRPRSLSWCFPEARAVTMAWGHCRPSRRSRETALPALP